MGRSASHTALGSVRSGWERSSALRCLLPPSKHSACLQESSTARPPVHRTPWCVAGRPKERHRSNTCNRAVTSVRGLLDDEHLARARLAIRQSRDPLTVRLDLTGRVAVTARSAVLQARAEIARACRRRRAPPSPSRDRLSREPAAGRRPRGKSETRLTCNRWNQALRPLRLFRAVRPLRWIRPLCSTRLLSRRSVLRAIG